MNKFAHTKLVLASSSPRRLELIKLLRLPVEVVPSDVDESLSFPASPEETVEILALRKAEAVYKRIELEEDENKVVIGSDTIVVLDGVVLGKPLDDKDAFQMLTSLQGREHLVYTGIACIDMITGNREIAHQMTKVTMKAMNEREISSYIATKEPQDKAGAYGIQGFGGVFVEYIDGCYFNVIGLPISLLSKKLTKMGIEMI